MARFYKFKAEEVRNFLINDMKYFDKSSGTEDKKMIIYIDGSVNANIAAVISTQVYGKDRIIAVYDVGNETAKQLCNYLELKYYYTLDVANQAAGMISEMIADLKGSDIPAESDKYIQKAAEDRLVMTYLYALSNLTGGRVIGTYTLSERSIGWRTKYGEVGDYIPFGKLTHTEVYEIGYIMDIPKSYYQDHSKLPLDQYYDGKITYELIDKFVREEIDESENQVITLLNSTEAVHKERLPYMYTPPIEDLYVIG